MTKAKKTTRKFGAEVDKILQLMIHSLYSHKDIFLRELISNASDACDKLRYELLTNDKLKEGSSETGITITADEENKTLTISDNGIGMNKDDLIENLGTIARSGTQRFLEAMTGDNKKDLQLIGQFGVGFYSSFMVADEVTVYSKKAGETQVWKWHSKGDGQFSVEESNEELEHGTKIILHVKEDCAEFLDKHRIDHIVKTYSDHISFPVKFIDNEGKEETINSGAALWARAKNDITKEQYTEFYHHVGHTGDEPWLTLHNKSEGVIEFTNLLFIPSSKPFDLFHPDRETRVKLYVKKVFITEQDIELVPRHMRFLRGVVDSQDLPLNISRETLQHNAVINKIRQSIVSKTLSELKKKAEKEPEEYTKFWDNFGAVLKEGLCEGIDANREKLLEVCRFKTTKSGDKLISLDEYIANMAEGQEEIYFLTGENYEAIKNSPQLEGFTGKDIEVILLYDHVDGFWVNVNREYKGKNLVSATKSGISLDNVKEKENKENKKDKKQNAENIDEIIAFFKTTLDGKIQDVIESNKLTDSPVCMSIPEGGMDPRLERFLKDQNQIAATSLKILEINPSHPIITSLGKNLKDEKSQNIVRLLFDQACIIEGDNIEDPGSFSKRLNEVLSSVLAA